MTTFDPKNHSGDNTGRFADDSRSESNMSPVTEESIKRVGDYWQPPVGFTGAIEYRDGYREWWRNGELHRDDGPAIEDTDGARREWCREGKRHREGGPAIEKSDGTRMWYQNGKRHRDEGPAVEHPDGTWSWWRHGLLHRIGGPAIHLGHGEFEWWEDGVLLRTSREDPQQ